MKINATFVKTYMQDSGSDSVLDYKVYEFTDITTANGKKYNNKWFKVTKLLENVNPIVGKKYSITLSDKLSKDAINMPYPIEISDGKNTFIKAGGTIKKIDINNNETNLSTRRPRLKRN